MKLRDLRSIVRSKKGFAGIAMGATKQVISLVVFLAVVVAIVPLALVYIGNLSALDIVLISAIVAILPILIGVWILSRGAGFFGGGR